MNKINYDFSAFIDTLIEIKMKGVPTPALLQTIKSELNRFFDDSKCKEVLYTTNTDKMFFGMKIVPMIDADDIFDYLIDDEPQRINRYVVEFDSHLFDPIIDLGANELLAIILHEVSRLVGNSEPMDNARNALNAYLAANHDYLRISDSIHYKEILAYGLKDYLSKCGSMFYTADSSEFYSNEFATSYGYVDDLVSAYGKIATNNIKLYENSEVSKFIAFSWVLSVYRNLKVRRVGAINVMKRAKQLTGSRLEQMEIENVIRRIGRIDDTILIEGAMDSIKFKIKDKMRKARLNNLRTIDSTFYELTMQVKNVEDENDALYLMRQINTSISIIDEYHSSTDCDDYEKEQWRKMLEKFTQLREKLVSSVVYKNKTYGLFVNYPEIVENRY